jgi:hypothetical protein
MQWIYKSTNALYNKRKVKNLYFDGIGFTSLRDNLAGVPDRMKTSLSWYDCDWVRTIEGLILLKQT